MDSSKVIIAVVVLLLLGGGAYFYFQDRDGALDDDNGAVMTQSIAPVSSPAAMTADDSVTASGAGVIEVGVKEFTVDGSNFKFEPSTMTVNKGDKVRIVFKNTGGFHDFTIDEFDGAKTKQIGANASETIEFVADKTGNFEYYCSVGNHRGMGMKGTLTVK